MCDPISIISGVLSGASAISGAKAANGAAAEQERVNAVNSNSARTSAYGQYVDLGNRKIQEQISATTHKTAVAGDVARSQATAQVVAGEAGVSGHSVQALMADYAQRGGNAAAITDQQTSWTNSTLDRHAAGVTAQAQDRINAGPRRPRANPFATMLQIAGGALDATTGYIGRNP